jgi:hypothetical protein
MASSENILLQARPRRDTRHSTPDKDKRDGGYIESGDQCAVEATAPSEQLGHHQPFVCLVIPAL